MLEKGVIQKANSPYSSPVLLTKKSDGTYRFYVDFCELNRVTEKDAFPMPHIDEIFSKLYKARVLSLVDLRSGYWQLPMAREDRSKTAFCVNGQQYEFLRMPFGLCNAPVTFRRLLLRLLDGLDGVVVYGDDIVIFANDMAEHVQLLEAVLQKISEAGLKLSSKKCQIARDKIVCLGHTVGGGQIQPLPEKLTTIKNFPAPKSKRQLRSFLGLVGYESKFVPKFAEKAKPLFQLLKKDHKFQWNQEAEKAFAAVKDLMTSRPHCLRIPNPQQTFTVSVDASDTAIGAVLSQPDGIVEYASRLLTDAEKKYSTTEKECLAIVWAQDKWRACLLATEFRVVSDHKPLTWLMTTKDPRGRLARWAYRLQEFNFSVTHVKGKENRLPDALSRPEHEEDQLPAEAIPVNTLTALEKDISSYEREDAVASEIIKHLSEGTKPNPKSTETRKMLRIWNKLSVDKGRLVCEVEVSPNLRPRKVPYAPIPLRAQLLCMAHDGTHAGKGKVLDALR
ncbi:reverse transcriptase/ribonuclease H family protein [Streptococcus dysgalactiae]|uniref:reverse transcriptase/ribonuclease H family protein n=1 Tax=Streptococcus dysgalactiae TaxID=1334 RepID=UPI001951F576|nr:reverse transcriptase family protein [Streptococcus dysgalactiae]MBM6549298.1 hypothetical protein [Streptococcus dysgalactiae subsp. equisimilis]